MAAAGGAEAGDAVSALRPRLVALGRRLGAPGGAGGEGERPEQGGDGAEPCPALLPARSALCRRLAAPREPAGGRRARAPGQPLRAPLLPPQKRASSRSCVAGAGPGRPLGVSLWSRAAEA